MSRIEKQVIRSKPMRNYLAYQSFKDLSKIPDMFLSMKTDNKAILNVITVSFYLKVMQSEMFKLFIQIFCFDTLNP